MSVIDFLKATKAEMKHVSWPSQRRSVVLTVLVVVITFALAGFMGGLDYIFTRLLDFYIL